MTTCAVYSTRRSGGIMTEIEAESGSFAARAFLATGATEAESGGAIFLGDPSAGARVNAVMTLGQMRALAMAGGATVRLSETLFIGIEIDGRAPSVFIADLGEEPMRAAQVALTAAELIELRQWLRGLSRNAATSDVLERSGR